MMDEKRRYHRFTVEGIAGNLMFATDVDILNISVNGVALKANRRLEIDREYTLKLQFRDKVISLNGVVAWSVLSELGRGFHEARVPVYKAGMRFTNVMSEKMAKLLEFIEQNKLEPDHRLTIRFDVRSPDKASLDGPQNYRVRKVSDSGMLIETDLPFRVEEQLAMEISLRGHETIHFVGRVASCLAVTDKVPRHYDIGIEFMQISGGDKDRFHEFIESLRFIQS
jgi:hypothetical protein